MINKFVELTADVLTIENEVSQNQGEIDALERKYLEAVIKIVKKGIAYEKIVTKSEFDEKEYYHSNEGKSIKGILLDENNHVDQDNGWEGRREDSELYLLEDGTLKVFYVKQEWIDQRSDLYRYISKHQEVEQFDVDYIVNTIERHLQYRLKDLSDRKKAQLARLEKLRDLKL